MPDVAAMVATNAVMRQRATAIAQGVALRRLAGFSSWYDSAAITSLASDIASAVEASQRQVTSLTNAYLSRVVGQMTGRAPAPVGLVNVTMLRAGISHVGAYARLADQHRFLTASGLGDQAASERNAKRTQAMIATDVALAFRAQAQAFMLERNVPQWRRVIRPELTAGGACGLCQGNTAAHSSETLMAIHPGCVCDIAPVIGEHDPGEEMNRADLRLVTGALPADDVIVHHHGELGPLLADRYQQWRSPADVAAA